MIMLSKKQAIEFCEENGEAFVRARIQVDGQDADINMLAWLLEKDAEKEKSLHEEQKEMQFRAIIAAEKSARYSMWSSIIALVTVIVTISIYTLSN